MAKSFRFGFLVDQAAAQQFYAILKYQYDQDVTYNRTKLFEDLVAKAFSELPKGYQKAPKLPGGEA